LFFSLFKSFDIINRDATRISGILLIDMLVKKGANNGNVGMGFVFVVFVVSLYLLS
jgi:hypothetical protein